MIRGKTGSLIVLCLLSSSMLATAASATVVTNPTPAVSATMELVGSAGGVFTWSVNGKVKPAYRGFGASVQLVCQQYSAIGSGQPPLVFGSSCPFDSCPSNVDACGNFNFNIALAGPSPQLDNSYICNFIVHVDGASQPSMCSAKSSPPDAFPADPNGSAPCSGGLCPDAP